MTTYRSRNTGLNLPTLFQNTRISRGASWGVMILGALVAFEIFNFSTTEFALGDVLGDLRFSGIRWATILSVAFCGIDFAGIARLFTPEQGRDEPAEVWYLFGAWLLAAAMNAILTWWGVSVAIVSHTSMGSAVINSTTITQVVPVFVAVMVWLIRVLIIGTFSLAGERIFSQTNKHNHQNNYNQSANRSSGNASLRSTSSLHRSASSIQPAPKPRPVNRPEPTYSSPEPTYHNLTFRTRSEPQGDRKYDI
ncbi:MAG: hypothetical protein JXA13_14645 [Anaerolineales bacterium]|nr:hypothetical protein [Anaerolineales bacterium]